MRCVLYRADVKLRACSGSERPEQPKSKLFSKQAVELFVLNLSARLSASAATWSQYCVFVECLRCKITHTLDLVCCCSLLRSPPCDFLDVK